MLTTRRRQPLLGAHPTRRRHGGLLAALTIALILPAAYAHDAGGAGAGSAGVVGGLFSGFAHPWGGWDHIAAMLAVGLWAVTLGGPARWALPLAFPLAMAAGGALGLLGVALPAVEVGIALSALVLGSLVALALRLPLGAAVLLVGVFAVFHGHAHGTELPQAAHPLAYGLGFVVATVLLHGLGVALALSARGSADAQARSDAVRSGLRGVVRVLGGVIALAGVGFLTLTA